MAQQKMVRVRVLRGFTGYASDAEQKPEHLPGAVIDLQETDARAEFHIRRCEEVDPSTPLAEGFQDVTSGETADQIRKREQVEAKVSLDERIANAVAAAIAKAKK